MTATAIPCCLSHGTMARESGLFPAPVREAHTAITGFDDRSACRAPSITKSAPVALTRADRCSTSTADRSE